MAPLATAFRARLGDEGRSTPPVIERADETKQRLLDPDTFRELFETIGAPRTHSLVSDFERSMLSDLSAREAAIATTDLASAGELAHLCLIFRAPVLAMRVRAVESAAEGRDLATIRPLAAPMSDALSSTLLRMWSSLGELDAASLGQ